MSSSVAEKLAKKSTKRTSTKQVRLKLVYIDFWSAVKLSFLAAIAVAVVIVVFFFLVYTVLNTTGVFTKVGGLFTDIAGPGNNILQYVNLPQVMAFAGIVALLNLIVITLMGALLAGLYNLSVKITGGLLVGFTNN
ncbi:DUF3566 domain-containing protein [Plantibacter sp. VKM Ac-2885]|jgi:hypothetical protein|uniref:Transmembrane protein DUF3566 n=2 Tax=Plantibacter TaxID=190323 RepID=A0A1S7B4K2_9MICO|nr:MULTISPECIES: DUF3566 domain-containing protein [Plantibacter]HXH35188.1 DUF3566 domain-containing protein [Plantibacter sp.]AQX78612.1 hypothetical protein BWO91_00040 [Plantibacter flavus]AZH82108.1 DUF3566 domain-containing protein [Plantibacter sp. PA-3-X8]KQM16716.1 hypothetical protein ASE44_13145 [Plantibacter sp. Leaf1]KQQ52818.1 hypothetical protein ASF68_11145 [Plantibacter sp. Leaf314]